MAQNPHSGHRQRMLQRFQSEGLSGFADHEALELLLFYAIPRRDVNPLAHALIARFGSLSGVLEAPREELLKLDGISERSAQLLSMMLPLFRLYTASRGRQRPKLDSTARIIAYARANMAARNREAFLLLCLDAKCRLVRVEEFDGVSNGVTVNPRNMIEAAALSNAAQVVFVHNHPGGEAKPSPEDTKFTQKMYGLFSAMSIELVDHVITSDEDSYSYYKAGKLDRIRAGVL